MVIFTHRWTRKGYDMIFGLGWAMLLFVVHVVFLGRAPYTKVTLSSVRFLLIMGLDKGDTIVWYWVTRHPQVFRGLTVCQRTIGF